MQSKTLQPYFLLALLVGATLLAFNILKPFLAPLLLAVIFAVVLQPVYRFVGRRLGGYESIASLLTILIFTVCLLVPATFVASQLVFEAQELYTSVSERGAEETFGIMLSAAESLLTPFVPDAAERMDAFVANIDVYARQGLDWIIRNIGTAFSGVATFLLALFIFYVALYYLIRDGHLVVRRLVDLSPLSDRDDTTIFDRLGKAIDSVIKGQLFVALIQGTLTGIGFFLFGIPNAVLWGVVAAVAALVPSLGTALVIAPAVAYLALTGSLGAAIGLGAWGAVAVGLVDNILGPKFMSSGLHLHPLIVILAVIGGIMLFGPIGLFLGPLSMSLLFVLLSIYRDVYRRAE